MSKPLKVFRKLVTPTIFVMGIIIFVLSIAGMTQDLVTEQSYSYFAVILAMVILMWMTGALNTYLEKTSAYDNYDVEQQAGATKKGSENAGFDKETGGDAQDPHKGISVKSDPKDADGIEKKDAEKCPESGEKWQKNYVPFTEEEDSNKNKE